MKNIFIIGCQGYNKNYGGWETFVKNLCDFYDKSNTTFYVTELATEKNIEQYESNGIKCIPVYTKKRGNATMFIHAVKAYFYILKYIKKNRIENAIVYILGLRQGPILTFTRWYVKKNNIRVLVNPDGLEWKRSKWNKFIKFCFKWSEKTMTKHCDGIVCDSKGIKDYLEKEYSKNKVPKYFIAYGTKKVNLDDVDEKEILKEYKISKNKYCLVVGRCVPENNFELIIREFMKSKIKKDLVIVSNITGNSYYEELKRVTECDKDSRIRILPGIYDEKKLSVIRKNAFLYLHGHSVGGTNPSLLEALSLTDLNVLYDVNFNKYVGKKSCLYFSEKPGSLSKLLNKEDYLKDISKKMGKEAKLIIENEFTWDIVTEAYRKIFEQK